MSPEDSPVMEITLDTIKELRRRGFELEAQAMLNRYYEEIKSQGRQALNDLLRKDRRVKIHLKICRRIGCLNLAYKKFPYCLKHLEVESGYKNKMEVLKCLTQKKG